MVEALENIEKCGGLQNARKMILGEDYLCSEDDNDDGEAMGIATDNGVNDRKGGDNTQPISLVRCCLKVICPNCSLCKLKAEIPSDLYDMCVEYAHKTPLAKRTYPFVLPGEICMLLTFLTHHLFVSS